jgi:hypothetical protein
MKSDSKTAEFAHDLYEKGFSNSQIRDKIRDVFGKKYSLVSIPTIIKRFRDSKQSEIQEQNVAKEKDPQSKEIVCEQTIESAISKTTVLLHNSLDAAIENFNSRSADGVVKMVSALAKLEEVLRLKKAAEPKPPVANSLLELFDQLDKKYKNGSSDSEKDPRPLVEKSC